MTYLILFAASCLIAIALTHLVRRYALAHSVLDRPNSRSSHDRPVPRGGGLAIVGTFIGGSVALVVLGLAATNHAIALIGGAVMVSFIGWLDDRRGGVSAGLRIAVHTTAAVWALAWIGGLDRISLGPATLGFGVLGSVLATVGVVWWINLYNFMDGIDGLAAGQAVTVAGFGALLILMNGPSSIAGFAILLAGASLGFLFWNWAPARIFMGDAGSGFLGFVFAVLAIAAEHAGALPLVAWLMLSGVFLFDSTVTLVRRVLRGERWYTAHRSHAYQKLVAFGYSHWRVTTYVLFLNAILAGITYIATVRPSWLPAAAGVTIVLLGFLYLLVEILCVVPAKDAYRSRRIAT